MWRVQTHQNKHEWCYIRTLGVRKLLVWIKIRVSDTRSRCRSNTRLCQPTKDNKYFHQIYLVLVSKSTTGDGRGPMKKTKQILSSQIQLDVNSGDINLVFVVTNMARKVPSSPKRRRTPYIVGRNTTWADPTSWRKKKEQPPNIEIVPRCR